MLRPLGVCGSFITKCFLIKSSIMRITRQKLNNTPAQYKQEYGWLKEIDSLALANAQRNLQRAYNNFFKNPKAGFPKFKSQKCSRRSYTTNCVNENISIENGCIKLPKIGLVKRKQHRQIPSGYQLKSVTVSQTPSGKYYVSVLFEYDGAEFTLWQIRIR